MLLTFRISFSRSGKIKKNLRAIIYGLIRRGMSYNKIKTKFSCCDLLLAYLFNSNEIKSFMEYITNTLNKN